MTDATLRAPFPWFGGKSRVADVVWRALGPVPNYVEPFAGSLAVLLARPHAPKIETVNDLDCYLANFWRALAAEPADVARHADWPVNEADLSARHQWLVDQAAFRERMATEPDFFDVQIAGWWVWGLCCWIGSGWCADRKLPHLGDAGRGVHRQLPHLGNAGRGEADEALDREAEATRVAEDLVTPLLLALDPSIACTGGVFVTLDGRAELEDVFAVLTFADETHCALAKQHAANGRGLDLFAAIVAACKGRNVACVAYEVPLGAKDSNAAWSLARATQAARIAIAVACPTLRPLAVSPYEAKLAACGTKKPANPKAAIAAGVRRVWGPNAWDLALAMIPDKQRREAIYDAGAVALAALRTKAARLVIHDERARQAARGGAAWTK